MAKIDPTDDMGTAAEPEESQADPMTEQPETQTSTTHDAPTKEIETAPETTTTAPQRRLKYGLWRTKQ